MTIISFASDDFKLPVTELTRYVEKPVYYMNHIGRKTTCDITYTVKSAHTHTYLAIMREKTNY
jgi:hypothetical protein